MIKAGTLIVCQNDKCNMTIGRITRDVFAGEAIHESMINGIEQEIHVGDSMSCKSCGRSYFANGMFHTENGWAM